MPLNQMQVRCTLAVALVSLTAGCAAQPAPSPTQVASSKALPASGTSDASGVQEPAPCTFAPHGTPAKPVDPPDPRSVPRSGEAVYSLALSEGDVQVTLDRANAGEDFDALVRELTDDSPPGIYRLSNLGVTSASGEYPRNRMVAAFGNVGFGLGVGDIGMADFDPRTSPYGWHIIKRLS